MGTPANISLTDRLREIEAEIAAGRAESALPRCLEIATLYPRALAVQRVLGEIYLALRRPREALAALDRALTGDPEDARACCARAIVHQMHGDQMAALAWYHRACDIRPEDATLRATYRDMAAALGQPPYQPGRVGLARLYLRGDLFTHAIREWESLVAENSDSTRLEAHVGLIETLWRAGRPYEAEAWARRTLTNAPSCLKPLLIAGAIAHDDGRDLDAQPFLRRAADLDPDFRAARALFSDRLGAGDTALGVLLWGDTPPFDAALSGAINGALVGRGTQDPQDPAPPPTGQRITQPAERRVNRPLVGGLSQTGGATTRTDLNTAPASPLPPPSAGRGELPPGFHNMFKETEGMLWNPASSEPDALTPITRSTAPVAAPPSPPPAPMMAPGPTPRESIAPPPAIAESGFALGDTEMRRAIRWVQWLQAQGARSLGEEPQRAQPSGSIDALLNAPPGSSTPVGIRPPAAPPMPAMPPIVSLPSMPSMPSIPRAPSGSLPSGPLAAPSSADLRKMFAELDPGAQAQDGSNIVDADPAPPSAPQATAPAGFASALGWPGAMPSELEPSDVEPPEPELSWPELPERAPSAAPLDATLFKTEPFAIEPLPEPAPDLTPEPRPAPVPEPPFAADPRASLFQSMEMPAAPSGPPASPAGSTPDATIEELDRLGAADGYMPFTLEPGALAAFAGAAEGAGAPERAGDWLDSRAPEAPLPPPITPGSPEAEALVMPEIEPDAGAYAAPEPPEPEPEPVSHTPELLTPPAGPDPHDYTARLEQARGHRDAGSLDEAIVEYRTVVRNSPDLLPDVLADVEGCLVDRPEHPELHRLLGDARIRQGDYIGAIESYNRATALAQAADS